MKKVIVVTMIVVALLVGAFAIGVISSDSAEDVTYDMFLNKEFVTPVLAMDPPVPPCCT